MTPRSLKSYRPNRRNAARAAKTLNKWHLGRYHLAGTSRKNHFIVHQTYVDTR